MPPGGGWPATSLCSPEVAGGVGAGPGSAPSTKEGHAGLLRAGGKASVGPTRSLALHCARQALHYGCCRLLLPSERTWPGVRCHRSALDALSCRTRVLALLFAPVDVRQTLAPTGAGAHQGSEGAGAPFWVLDAWVLPGQLGRPGGRAPRPSARVCQPRTGLVSPPHSAFWLQSVSRTPGHRRDDAHRPRGHEGGPFLGLPRGTCGGRSQ